MNSKNNWIRDYLGVTAWHKAGYDGSHGLTASGEDFTKAHPSDHAAKSYEVFREIAPARKVIFVRYRDSVKCAADTMFVSLSGLIGAADRAALDAAMPPRLTMFVSAGNDGEDKANQYMYPKKVYGVAAVKLLADVMVDNQPVKGEIHPMAASYSSTSRHVDFAAPTDLCISSGGTFGGTSCACPVLAGMAALVNDKAIADYGRPMTHEAMYRLLKDISVDIEAEGRDDKTGWGMPILPPPDKLDLRRYIDMTYKDDDKIAAYHKADVYRAAELGLMLGDGDSFEPDMPLTRQQAASIVVRLYDKLKEAAK